MADEKNEATTHADLYQRHEQDPSGWEEKEAVTGRPPDEAPDNSTLGSRAAARSKPSRKQVDEAENKQVGAAESKTRRRRS